MRVVKNEKLAKKIVDCKNFMKNLTELKNLDKSDITKCTKIKFKNRRERMKFYSGKTEQIKEKYERMRNEFEEVQK